MYGAETLPAITTGEDFVTASSKMMTVKKDAEMDEGKPKGVLAGSLGGLAKSMSLLVSTNLLQNEILFSIKDAILGLGPTDQEKKEGSIDAGDTDKPPKEKGPGILSKVGSTLGKLNPFGGGGFMDTLLKLGLAVGGLALLNIFGDKLTGPLAGLIKAFKEGKIGEKIGEIVTDIQEYLTPLWDKIKIKVGEFIDNVKLVFNLVVGAAKAIDDYMMQFDTSGGGPGGRYGDGKLDQFEKAKMFKDLKDKIITPIVKAIFDFAADAGNALIKGLGLITLANIFSKFTPLAPPGKGDGKSKKGRRGKGMKLTRFGAAAIGFIVIGGIFSFATDVANAFNDQLDEEKKKVLDELKVPDGNDKGPTFTERLSSIGDMAKGFLSKFIVGDQTGSNITNILGNAMEKGMQGAAIGFVASGAGLTGPGTGFATTVGFVAGAIFGAVSAAFGEENVKKALDGATDNLGIPGMILDYITDMYDRLILKPFEWIFNKLGLANDELMKSLKKMGIDYGPKENAEGFLVSKSKETLYGENVNPNKVSNKTNEELLLIQQENEEAKKYLRKSKGLSFFGLFDILEEGYMDTQHSRKVLEILKVVNAELEMREVAGNQMGNFSISDKIEKFKEPKFGPSKIEFGSSRQGGITYANNISDNSIKKQENQNLFGNGMSQDNPQFAAILAHNQSKLKTG